MVFAPRNRREQLIRSSSVDRPTRETLLSSFSSALHKGVDVDATDEQVDGVQSEFGKDKRVGLELRFAQLRVPPRLIVEALEFAFRVTDSQST